MLLVYLVTWYALSQTAWGKHIYAVGGNPQASDLSGIKSGRVLLSVYVTTGVIAAIAAWAALGRIPNADPNAYQNANLETITAVVIGGTSLFGGRGGVRRHPGRHADRRRAAQRPHPGRGRQPLPEHRHRHPGDRGGGRGPVRPQEITMSSAPVLEARGLVKRYGNVTAINGADFELREGEVLAVIGDNGAGKSQSDQGAGRRGHSRCRSDPDERLPGVVQEHPGRQGRRHRDGVPGPRGGAGPRHRVESVSRPRSSSKRHRRQAVPPPGHARGCGRTRHSICPI